MARAFVALDVETTGTDPASDRIIEVAAIRFTREAVLDRFHSLVNPGRAVPLRIERLTGIRSLELFKAPAFADVRDRLRTFLSSDPLIGQSIHLDVEFLRAHGLFILSTLYDTFELGSVLVPRAAEHSLGGLARWFGVTQTTAHRAMDDADVARQVFLHLLDHAASLDRGVLEEVARVLGRVRRAERELLQMIIDAPPPVRVAPRPASRPEVTEARRRRAQDPALRPVDVASLEAVLAPGGGLATTLAGYEVRPGQLQMVREIAHAFNDGHHLIVEAGTGIGKSLAYLVPAFLFAAQNDTPVVVSTNTLNLQDQLVRKDIPAVLAAVRAAGFSDIAGVPIDEVRIAQLKGRSNYLCLRRWGAARRSLPDGPDEARLLARTLVWLPVTTSGDRAELNLTAAEGALWSRIAAQPDNCLNSDCGHLRDGSCFLARARNSAAGSHLIVTNHALLLTDLAGEGRILPDYDHLVIDEAHHLEDQATTQFGSSLNRQELMALLARVDDPQGGPIATGLATDLFSLSRDPFLAGETARTLQVCAEALRAAVERARVGAAEFFRQTAHFAQTARSGDADRLRIKAQTRQRGGWANVEVSFEPVESALDDVERWLARAAGELEAMTGVENLGELQLEVGSTRLAFSKALDLLRSAIRSPDPLDVYWVTPGSAEDTLTLARAPLDVAGLLEERLFARKRTVILTSATLAVGGSTAYVRQRVGAVDAREAIIPAPFDYQSAVLLGIARDIPEPGTPGHQAAVEAAVRDLTLAARGRALALFTSHSALRTTHRAIKAALADDDILVLGQGVDGSPRQLLQAFLDNPRSLLLGTSAFWEGIDVVGDALSLLIIGRLPFAVPSDPMYEARTELFERPFEEYAVPQAAIRLKQGFGRLIRSSTDRGVAVLLDRRIDTRSYGRTILAALPACTLVRGSTGQLVEATASWLTAGPPPGRSRAVEVVR